MFQGALQMLLPKSFHFIALFFASADFIHPKTFNFKARTKTFVEEIYSEEKCVSAEESFSHFSTQNEEKGRLKRKKKKSHT